LDDVLIKNWFANRYHFTPETVDKMSVKDISVFMEIEKIRDEHQKKEKTKQEHKMKSERRNKKW